MARKIATAKAEPKKQKRTLRKAKSIIGKIAKTTKKKVAAKTTSKPKKSKTSARKLDTNNLYDRIQQKAFELFEKRGYSHGNDIFDWSIAEELVRLESEQAKRRKKNSKLTPEQLQRKTEQKAYELFERKGYSHGYDINDWAIARQLVELENS